MGTQADRPPALGEETVGGGATADHAERPTSLGSPVPADTVPTDAAPTDAVDRPAADRASGRPAAPTRRAGEPGGGDPGGRGSGGEDAGRGEPPDPRALKASVREFRLRERLGGGAFGVVYRAWDRQLHKPVAVKLFAPDGGERAPLVDRLLHEARAASRLDHPNIVRVLRAETVPLTAPLRALLEWERRDGAPTLPEPVGALTRPDVGTTFPHDPARREAKPAGPPGSGPEIGYIVSELITGGTLQAQFNEAVEGDSSAGAPSAGDPPPDWATPAGALRFVLPIAEATGHAHRLGVVHRDLKPANVLLTPDGRPMLTDFGIARASHRPSGDDTVGGQTGVTTAAAGGGGSTTLSGEGRWLGTPAYMAPEQAAQRSADVCAATDVWALGVILWELLAGRRMYHGSGLEIIDRILREPPPELPRTVPPAARRVVAAALQADPADRPRNGAVFADQVREALKELDRRPAGVASVIGRRANVALLAVAAATALLWLVWANAGRDANPDSQQASAGVEQAGVVDATDAATKSATEDGPGLRSVKVVTEPPGATVWLFPIDAAGAPQLARMVDFPGKSPSVHPEVPQGWCLVVAEAWVRPDGRPDAPPVRKWAEVERYIFEPEYEGRGFTDSTRTTLEGETSVLAPIVLHTTDELPLPAGRSLTEVRDGLVFESPVEEQITAPDGSVVADPRQTPTFVPAFYVSLQEQDSSEPGGRGDVAVAVTDERITYDRAVTRLEGQGLRMPSLTEWERIRQHPELIPEGSSEALFWTATMVPLRDGLRPTDVRPQGWFFRQVWAGSAGEGTPPQIVPTGAALPATAIVGVRSRAPRRTLDQFAHPLDERQVR
ncbi:serine/threonine-protein kinase [Alienimonas californiensis]|uniref:serine/threonine-protein kinase n=1 Tax=Alienimonas californiensis TaxID=2527989 RepID=UPI0011A89F29|nr:serine/threonine-protein kinase [Alienimonas californiensis]